MPEYLRALVVVIVFAVMVFGVAARPVARIIGVEDFRRWRNLWFAVTITAFLAGNFWIYVTAVTILLLFALRAERNRPAIFLLLLSAVPPVLNPIPGFGVINYLFDLTHERLLEILILLPAIPLVFSRIRSARPGKHLSDRILVSYFILVVALGFREASVTAGMRHATMMFIGFVLPYFVFSRWLKTHEDLQRTMLAFLLPIFVLAVLGVFETTWNWHLFWSTRSGLSGEFFGGTYLYRVGSLRAATTAAGPIAFGYSMMIGLGFLLAFSRQFLSKKQQMWAFAAITLGLVSSLSRGPWVGAAVLILVFFATGGGQARSVARLGFFLAVPLMLLSQTPLWNTIVGLIPFVGDIQSESVDYRVLLVEKAWVVIQNNPWFGSIDFRSTAEMQSMIQGQGIIDIVNTYVGIALNYGFVGLALFVGFFLVVVWGLRKAFRSLPVEEEGLRRTGRALFATLVAVLVTIGTVSGVGTIPILYWSLAGMAVAYSRIVRRRSFEKSAMTPLGQLSKS